MLQGSPLPTFVKSRLGRRDLIEEDEMKSLYTTERLFEDLFGVRREFDEMFNRILVGWNCLSSKRPSAFTQQWKRLWTRKPRSMFAE